MERKTLSLTDKKVQALKPKEKAYVVYDEKGLFIYVSTTGVKTWRYKYMDNGKNKVLTLGQYPILSLADARQMRNEAMKQRNEGIDPVEYKQARKKETIKKDLENSMTFSKVYEDWLRVAKSQWRPSTYKGNLGRFKLHILPVLGQITMSDLTFEDVKKVPLKLEQDGKYDAAEKTAQLITQVCGYAKRNHWAQHNIADGLTEILAKRPITAIKEYPAVTDPKGIATMLQNIHNYIEYRRLLTPMGGALKLAPILALRPTELLAAQWHEIDFDKGIFSIPAIRMKAKKNHFVPLARQAIDIFKDLFNRRTDDKYIFKSCRQGGHIKTESLNKALHTCGVPLGEMCIHGWRKVFSTLCNEALAPRELVEKCLAHSIGNEVEQAYNKAAYIEPRRQLMQWYADTLDALREGTQRPVLKFDMVQGFA